MVSFFKIILFVALFFIIEILSESIAKNHSLIKFMNDAPLKRRKWCQFIINTIVCTIFMFITKWYAASAVWYFLIIVTTVLYKWIENDRYIEEEYYE